MKKLVIGMLACFTLVAASSSFAASSDKDAAASLIIDGYKAGAVSEMEANQMIDKVFTPYEVGAFAAYLMGKLYQGGKWVVVNGVQTGWSTFLCTVDSVYESGALGVCSTISAAQGADALHACWDKAFTSSAWQKNCVGKSADAPQPAPLQ